jgi:F1F0 ATPase subunit 2
MNFMEIGAARLVFAGVAGMLAGVIYFGGLWWTVKRMSRFVHPRLALLVSFFARALVALTIIYLAAGGHAAGYLAGLAGFLLSRFIAVRRARPERMREAAGGS